MTVAGFHHGQRAFLLATLLSIPLFASLSDNLCHAQASPPFKQFFDNMKEGKFPLELNEQQLLEIEKIPISLSEEIKLGKQMISRYERHLRQQRVSVLRSGTDVKYLSQLVEAIHPLMTNGEKYKKIDVRLSDSTHFDARSFPGGTIYVSRGLMKIVPNEAALVGVLGHELSHLDHGHQLFDARRQRWMQNSFTSDALSASFSAEKLTQMASMAASFAKPYRPTEESAADNDGIRWAFELGYDPTEFAKLFRTLMQKNAASKRSLPGTTVTFFRSHPPNKERFDATRKLSQQLIKGAGGRQLILGTEAFRRRKMAAR